MNTTTDPRKKQNWAFLMQFGGGVLLYVLGVLGAAFASALGVPAWLPLLLVLPGIGLMVWSNVKMYRSGDEFERARIAEAVLFAFATATPLILAIGVLQFYMLPQINWIFAFSILMVAWLLGTLISATRYR